MRRVRLHFALGFVFMFGIYLPLFVGLLASHGSPEGVQYLPFLVMLVVFVERRRVTKEIAAKLGTSTTEASKILSTPTWRTSAWQRGPGATLIRAPAKKAPAHPTAAPAPATESSDRPTLT
jgi:hypothetical protein